MKGRPAPAIERVWRVRRDVDGDRYAEFVRVMLRVSTTFGLISQPKLPSDDSAEGVLHDLKHYWSDRC